MIDSINDEISLNDNENTHLRLSIDEPIPIPNSENSGEEQQCINAKNIYKTCYFVSDLIAAFYLLVFVTVYIFAESEWKFVDISKKSVIIQMLIICIIGPFVRNLNASLISEIGHFVRTFLASDLIFIFIAGAINCKSFLCNDTVLFEYSLHITTMIILFGCLLITVISYYYLSCTNQLENSPVDQQSQNNTGELIMPLEPNEIIEDNCAICMEAISDITIGGKLSCAHIFHTDCIKKWFEVKTTCPICQQDAIVIKN
jgi:hypothetical protein